MKRYFHIRMGAKRRALEAIVEKADAKPWGYGGPHRKIPTLEAAVVGNSEAMPKKVPTMDRVN